MEVINLKKKIYDEEQIHFILEKLGCGNIRITDSHVCASFPDGDNPNGIVIDRTEYLGYRSFSRGVNASDKKDLIDLISQVKGCGFLDSLKFLHKTLDIPFTVEKKANKKEYEVRTVFLGYSKFMPSDTEGKESLVPLNPDSLSNDIHLLYYDWAKTITPKVRDDFGICYDPETRRIVIPHKYWATGELVGTNARTIIKDFDKLGIPKYVLTPTYKKSLNIYGLYENLKEIQRRGRVIVYEGEKSVLKRASRFDRTGVAVSGHTLSDEQLRILRGLKVEVIIAFDKDIPERDIREICKKLYTTTTVSYILDKWDMLGNKDSPADADMDVFDFLLKNRIRYSENEYGN